MDLTLCLVSGYVRNAQKLLMHHIAVDIVGVISTFAHKHECFALYHNYTAGSDGKMISKNKTTVQSAFGNVLVYSMGRSVHCWTFTILEMNKNRSMAFGITDFDDNNVFKNCFSARNTNNYCALSSHAECKRSRGQFEFYRGFRIQVGTRVKMQLDLKRKELIYYVDGKCLGAAYSDIVCGEDTYYKMAIYFQQKGSSVMLMKYTETL